MIVIMLGTGAKTMLCRVFKTALAARHVGKIMRKVLIVAKHRP